MSNDSQIQIDQMKSELVVISKPFIKARNTYENDLKNIILKYISSKDTFEKDYEKALMRTYEDFSNLSTFELVDKIDVFDEMLCSHINGFHSSDE